MSENYYYGHGKLLLSSEYFVLDGAKALALPTQLGQKMHVNYRPSRNPKLYWKSFDENAQCWFEASFEQWHFDLIDYNKTLASEEEVGILQKLLRQARAQNIHFMRDEVDVHVNTTLEFPRKWGLGTSSTLIYNIAQWAYVSPFELLEKTFGGSGYDIACAQSMGPIVYQNLKQGPGWETVSFNPVFKDKIFFLYLNQKQNSREGIQRYLELDLNNKDELINKLNTLTKTFVSCIDIQEFEEAIIEHEKIISSALDLPRVKDTHFSDYWGEVKSLGAWGGDFVMVTSDKDLGMTKEYFSKRGFETLLSFDDLILQNFSFFQDPAQKIEAEINHANQIRS